MGGEPITYGLVEMFVDLPMNAHNGSAFEDVGAVHARLRQRCGQAKKDRLADVLRILKDERLAGVDLLVFPGYTLPIGEAAIPKEIRDAIGERVVVLETFGAGDGKTPGKTSISRRTHVLYDGKALLRPPVEQQVITASDAEDGDRVTRVVRELRSDRRWTVRGGARCALVICGEVNVVKHSQTGEGWPLHGDLEKRLKPIDVVVNPAHTRTSLPAMHAKRDWFARGRVLLTTANLHGEVRVWKFRKETERWRIARTSSHRTAQLFIGASPVRRYDRDQMRDQLGARVVEVDGGHKVTVIQRARIMEVLHGA